MSADLASQKKKEGSKANVAGLTATKKQEIATVRIETNLWQDLGVELGSVEGDLAETENSLASDAASSEGGAREEQSRIATVDEEVLAAVRQHGWTCAQKGLWLGCESTCANTIDE